MIEVKSGCKVGRFDPQKPFDKHWLLSLFLTNSHAMQKSF